jgi:hypothetical protein
MISMNINLAKKITAIIRMTIGFGPWLSSMSLLFWLEQSGIWSTTTAYRDVMTIFILTSGMGLSFFAFSFIHKKDIL